MEILFLLFMRHFMSTLVIFILNGRSLHIHMIQCLVVDDVIARAFQHIHYIPTYGC